MLTLTRDAADVIKELAEGSDAAGIRISAMAHSFNGHGGGLQLEVASEPAALDDVVDVDGARIFLGPGAADALDGKVLDADVEGGEVRFAVLESEEPDQP